MKPIAVDFLFSNSGIQCFKVFFFFTGIALEDDFIFDLKITEKYPCSASETLLA
jgi:hypothetical protein